IMSPRFVSGGLGSWVGASGASAGPAAPAASGTAALTVTAPRNSRRFTLTSLSLVSPRRWPRAKDASAAPPAEVYEKTPASCVHPQPRGGPVGRRHVPLRGLSRRPLQSSVVTAWHEGGC